jgi:hypothetical protein
VRDAEFCDVVRREPRDVLPIELTCPAVAGYILSRLTNAVLLVLLK